MKNIMNEFDNAYVIHFKVIGFCRTCLLVVFICCKGYFLFAQPADSLAVHTLINEMNILSAKFPFSRVYTDNRIRQNNLSASLRDQIHSNINSRPDNSILVPSRKDGRYLAKNRNESQRMLNSFCKDSSFIASK